MSEESQKLIQECKDNQIPYVLYDFDFSPPKKDPDYMPPEIEDDLAWLKDLYTNILKANVSDQDNGVVYWMNEMKKGHPRQGILNYFKKVAAEDNIKNEKTLLTDHIKKNPNKKVLFVLKQSLGDAFICTSLFESIKSRYADHDLYVATQKEFMEVFRCHPLVHETILYDPNMENELLMVGFGEHEGLFDVYLNPAVSTQRQLNYLSNSKLDVVL